ncbi:hypothetical protein E2562_026476 [Oryza meyeriana var. granulata]|uniref:DUF1618 domain-containing protein n=1 Tax=Oryza meyeriana var. granulata TaxID=110450 RepID=A0A6G1DNI2_9ORYZ|nr:hypothetical protein E2562_026476 [Oryza meyeriana var. granulata]
MLDNFALLRRAGAGGGGFYICSLDPVEFLGIGHFELCFYEDGNWSEEAFLLNQLRNPPDRNTLQFTDKVITLDDEQGVVAFVDLWRGIVICNVLADGRPGFYLPLPRELITHGMSYSASLSRDIAIVNGLLTVVSLCTCRHRSGTGCWSWDLSTWSKPVARLDDDEEDWHEGFMVDSSDITVDDATTRNIELLPKLVGRPAMARLRLAHPTLSLTDANVVYIMGKVHLSDEKAVVLTVDMANKRLQSLSVYDAERLIHDFDYAYTQSTISQYFTTAAAGV